MYNSSKMAEETDVGFEEGMSWLPAHILREACGDFDEEQIARRARHCQHYHHHYNVNRSESHPFPPQMKSTSGKKYNNRGRHGSRASGGPGMQAVFLDPGHKPCGTGVFLPRRAGTDFQPSKKPACSPVLLPSRVVQALNINVQALGLQISPHQDQKFNQKGRNANNSVYKKEEEDDDLRGHCYVISQDRSSSPEIFLPKEWSY